MASLPAADGEGEDSEGSARERSPCGATALSSGPTAGPAAEATVADTRSGASAGPGTGSELLESIERLKKQQRDLKTEKKRIGKQLKNAEKRRGRLRKKAKLLSDQDLLEVLQMRGNTASSSSGPPVAGTDSRPQSLRPQQRAGAQKDQESAAREETDDHH